MAERGPTKRLALRRPDRCVVCGRVFALGTTACWHPGLRVVSCLDCTVPVAAEGDPGASARREYERRHERREAHARQKLGALGGFLAKVIDELSSTSAWKRGAAGEAFTARRLNKHLEGSDVRLLHDRRRPGHGAANIDHLAVGPGGITVIDSKAHRGAVRVAREGGLFAPRRDVLRVNGHDQTKLIEGVQRQMADVEAALARAADPNLDIRRALCFTETAGLPTFRSLVVADIVIDGPPQGGQPGEAPRPYGDRHTGALGRAFPPA